MRNCNLVIVGGGSAGMAAACKAYELGERDILILEKNNYLGGILNQCIHNGFGIHEFKSELTGPEFMTRFSDKVKQYNIEYKLNSTVINISEDKIITYSNEQEGIVDIQAKAIIFTTGCYERNAGAIQIPGDRPSGILTAGQAQLYLNNYGYLVGKKVFILGSGDIGLIMARRMTLEGAKVIGVAEINPYSAGLNRNIQQCLLDLNIPLYLSHTVKQIIGKSHVEKIVLAKVDEKFNFIPGTEIEFECDTLLLSIGLIPYTALLSKTGMTFSKTKGANVNQAMETDIPGIFSAGNALHVHDVVDYVVSEAKEAAVGAIKYLNGQLNNSNNKIDIIPSFGINYVIPQKLCIDEVDDIVTFKFRVNKPYKDINILFIFNGVIIKKIYKTAIIPSEMEMINISKSLFKNNNGQLEIKIEEKK